MSGWVLIHRSLFENPLWDDKPFSKGQAWIDLIMLANHEDRRILYKGEEILCKRGEVNRSFSWLAKRWGWDRKKVHNFVNFLENAKMATTNVTTHRTTITIEKYGVYQDLRTTNGTTNVPTVPQQFPSNSPHTKNVKNENNKNIDRFVPPSVDEVREYVESKNLHVDPEEFVNFYTSKGWMIGKNKMKQWRAAVGTWEKSWKKTHPDHHDNSDEDLYGGGWHYGFDV